MKMISPTYDTNSTKASGYGQRTGRIYSMLSTVSGDIDRTQLREILDASSKGKKRIQMAKMMALVTFPIVVLVTMTAYELVTARSNQEIARTAQREVNAHINRGNLVISLQIERGLSAMLLSSNQSNLSAFQTLSKRRKTTDQLLEIVEQWPIEFYNQTKSVLPRDLYIHRENVNRGIVNIAENIYFYSNITYGLMSTISKPMDLPKGGSFWTLLTAYSCLLWGSDAIGIQRALGSTFFTVCSFDSETATWFWRLDGELTGFVRLALAYRPELKEIRRVRIIDPGIEQVVNDYMNLMFEDDYEDQCRNMSHETRFFNSMAWFESVTNYISGISTMRVQVIDEVLVSITEAIDAVNTSVTVYTTITFFVCIACTALVLLYVNSISKIFSKMGDYARKVSNKTQQLSVEKTRTDRLLYQMLPKTVAEDLKAHRNVSAEYYNDCTVYFSDIVGFTSMVATLNPMQVVDMLNALYSLFDKAIDLYDVYKVETIGDAYMVVSGLPTPNGNKHAKEIACMAIHIRSIVREFRLPDMKEKKIRLRIGVHTGLVVVAYSFKVQSSY